MTIRIKARRLEPREQARRGLSNARRTRYETCNGVQAFPFHFLWAQLRFASLNRPCFAVSSGLSHVRDIVHTQAAKSIRLEHHRTLRGDYTIQRYHKISRTREEIPSIMSRPLMAFWQEHDRPFKSRLDY